MHIIAAAWMFVVLLMTAAEATSTQGTALGAFFTFLLYGVLPLSIVLYLLGTPARRRARLRTEATERAEHPEPPAAATAAPSEGQSAASDQGHSGGHTPGDRLAAVREEP